MLRAALVLVLLFAAACYLFRGPSERDRLLGIFEHSRATAPSMLDDAERAAPSPRGRALIHYLPSSCQPKSGGNPVIVAPDLIPHAGEPVRFQIVATWCSPRPDSTWFLAIGTRKLEPSFDLGGAGAPGCRLGVAWDSLSVLVTGDSSGLWSAPQPGVVEFNWTPRIGNIGQRWYIQAAIAAPGENAAGLLTTHVLELSIAP
jgi:hypothetical protein